MTSKLRDSAWDHDGIIRSILDPVVIPKMAVVRQRFDGAAIGDIPAAISGEFTRPEIAAAIEPGMSIAITVGSRGLANLPIIVREIVGNVKKLGGVPFIFPAMGSHGSATADGQRAMLEGFGVTESAVGAPIRATMETVVVGQTSKGQDVHADRYAANADGIIVLGRVKPHTAFRGVYESGLMKMMAIGIGKQKGAEACHTEGFGKMAENVPAFGKVILERTNVLFGIAVLENAFDETARIEAIPKREIERREPELLKLAKALMPSILIPRFDVLIVDKIGKNFSGDGADPNITGTYCTPYASGGPEFERYVVLDISEETHGNSLGVGMADVTTKRLYDKTDFDASYPNALTSRVVATVKMPMVMESDKLAIQAALFTCVHADLRAPKIVRILNTSHLGDISISESLLHEAAGSDRMEVIEDAREFDFDASGNLW